MSFTCIWKMSFSYIFLQKKVDLRQHVSKARGQDDSAAKTCQGRQEILGFARLIGRSNVATFF